MEHELQHARDICNAKCWNRCNVTKDTLFESYDEHCDQVMCMEVRALIVEGSCAGLSSAAERKRCISNMLYTYYGGLCTPESYVNAMDNCYYDFAGVVPQIPPFPY